MDKFQVTILGCGSAKPSLRHHPSAQLISYHDKLFLIDCGEGTQMQLMKARCKLNRMQHIFISHLHGDHCYGLPGLLSTMGLTGLCGEVTIHLPEEGVRIFKPLLEYSTHGLTVDFKPYPRESQVIYEDNTLTVRTIPLKHMRRFRLQGEAQIAPHQPCDGRFPSSTRPHFAIDSQRG